jgi:hypothetical protein
MKASAVITTLLLALLFFTQQTLVETNKTSSHQKHKHEEVLKGSRKGSISRNIAGKMTIFGP